MFVPLSLLSSPLVVILCRFGGPGGRHYYNNTLSFDTSTRAWTELQCAGCILSPRPENVMLLPSLVILTHWRGIDGRTGEATVAGKLNHLHFSFTYDIQLSNGSHFNTWGQDQAEGRSCHGFQRDTGLCDRRRITNKCTSRRNCVHSRPRLNLGHNVVKPSKKTT
jgi:hypothetical protein